MSWILPGFGTWVLGTRSWGLVTRTQNPGPGSDHEHDDDDDDDYEYDYEYECGQVRADQSAGTNWSQMSRVRGPSNSHR